MIEVWLAIVGAVFGSFITLYVHRSHAGQNWVSHPSHCDHCRKKLAVIDLVPVVSWLALRGRCRQCKKPISPESTVVEIILAVLFVVAFWVVAPGVEWQQLVSFSLLLSLLVLFMALAIYDVHWMILPDHLVFLSGIVAALRLVVTGLSVSALVSVIVSMAIAGGLFYVLFQLSDGKWIGGGDVKLGFALGVLLAYPSLSLLLLFIASSMGSIVSLGLMAVHRASRRSQVPFGPFLLAAAVVAILWGESIISAHKSILITG